MPNLVALGQNGVGKNGERWPLPFDPYNTPLCTFVTEFSRDKRQEQ